MKLQPNETPTVLQCKAELIGPEAAKRSIGLTLETNQGVRYFLLPPMMAERLKYVLEHPAEGRWLQAPK
jgi:hypothetical protein